MYTPSISSVLRIGIEILILIFKRIQILLVNFLLLSLSYNVWLPSLVMSRRTFFGICRGLNLFF